MSPVLSIITFLVLLATLVLKKKNKKIISINTLCHLFSHHDTNILDEGKKKNNQTKTNANSMLEHYLN